MHFPVGMVYGIDIINSNGGRFIYIARRSLEKELRYMRIVVLKMNGFWGGFLKKIFKIKD